jgi:tungstate transport system substrate-binding protein
MGLAPVKYPVKSGVFLGWLLALLMVSSLALAACSTDRSVVEPRWLVLLTTQELQDSGLLDIIIPPYEQANNVRVKRLPVTTAAGIDYALKAGVDVLLLPGGPALDQLGGPGPTYPPYQRESFPTPTAYAGPGPEPAPQPHPALYNERKLALWSELVALAPADDQLVKNPPDIAGFLKLVALNNAPFYAPAPAQEPGLAATQERFWTLKGLYTPADRGAGYRVLDYDSAEIVKKAAGDKAFTIAPLATFLKLQADPAVKGKLKIALPGDLALYQPYEVLVPNNAPGTDRDVKLARTFADYLTNQKAQALIAGYTPSGADHPVYRPTYFPVYVPK